jgi:hypothetical protein
MQPDKRRQQWGSISSIRQRCGCISRGTRDRQHPALVIESDRLPVRESGQELSPLV